MPLDVSVITLQSDSWKKSTTEVTLLQFLKAAFSEAAQPNDKPWTYFHSMYFELMLELSYERKRGFAHMKRWKSVIFFSLQYQ